VFKVELLKYVMIALTCSLATVLANRGIAVFNDGFRPIVPEYLEGRMDRKALAATSFAISFGLIIGFGIPTSLTASILLIHCIFLSTDVIGTMCPYGKKGMVTAGVIGAVYGIGLLFGLQFVVDLFGKLPINFLSALGMVATPITVAFAVFPAITVGLQFGFKKGAMTMAFTLLVRQLTELYGIFSIFEKSVALNKDGMALLAGMIVLIVFAIRDKEGQSNSNEMLSKLFEEKVIKIRKSIPILMVMGGLVSAGTSLAIMAGDPISLNLLAEGKSGEAAMTAFARAIGFIPLITTTAITTGVYAPAGMTFVFAVGLAIKNPIVAFIAGAITMGLEILLLNMIAKGLDKFPGVKRCGDNIRTAMSSVLEIALLLGGMMAAQQMAPGFGLFVVIGLFCLNKCSKKPLVAMAVGPVGAILVGLLINLLYLAKLFNA
jgi:hypothetical protein